MESLPNVALSKTYNIDAQTADSAGTATAFLCGVKTRSAIVGLDGRVPIQTCPPDVNKSKLDSILKMAHKAGKSIGIVTTTRVTHATPAAAYAHSSWRHWETYDGVKYTEELAKNEDCKDITRQLVEDNSFIDVINCLENLKFYVQNIF
jgi:alkaline phosphatase